MLTNRILIPLLNKLLKTPSPRFAEAHKKRKPLPECELVVVGNIRNGSEKIAIEIDNLHQATKNFKKVSFFVVESDSSDETVSKLQTLKSSIPNFDFVTMGSLSTQMPMRTQRLAHCRNRSLYEIINNKKYHSADFVAVADLDGVNETLTAEAIQTCWDTPVSWDVVTANQEGLYYDIWTLRHPYWCPNDCWKQYNQLLRIFRHEEAQEIAVTSRMVHLHRTAGFVEVDSAFGGFGIYARNAFISGRYNGLDEAGNQISDHIPYHADLKNNGFRIYINAALINAIDTEHTAWKRQRTRPYTSVPERLSGTSTDENGDVLYQFPTFPLCLPKDHMLPFYQQEHPLYDRFLPHLAKYLLPGEIVIDVGANCGDSLAAMCSNNPYLRYICIEPDPDFFSYLEKNKRTIEKAFGTVSIKLFQCLVGRKVKTAQLSGSGGTKTAVAVSELDTQTSSTDNMHNSLDLDAIVNNILCDGIGNIRLIKSDTDGYDYDVINSANSRLNSDKPILFFEAQFSDQNQRDGYVDMFENLISCEYIQFWIFDNFGNFLMHVNRLENLSHLLDYVGRQHFGKATRTIYYYDILACTDKDTTFLGSVVDEYVANVQG